MLREIPAANALLDALGIILDSDSRKTAKSGVMRALPEAFAAVDEEEGGAKKGAAL